MGTPEFDVRNHPPRRQSPTKTTIVAVDAYEDDGLLIVRDLFPEAMMIDCGSVREREREREGDCNDDMEVGDEREKGNEKDSKRETGLKILRSRKREIAWSVLLQERKLP